MSYLNEKKEREIEIEDEDRLLANDQLDLMVESIKVHTDGIDLNEDATLSNLDEEFSRYAKFTMEQIEIIGVLRGFFICDRNTVRYNNDMSKWGEEITYIKPEKRVFFDAKKLLLNKVHSIMILSRAVKGKPLKSFLTYGRDVSNKELGMEEKRGVMDRLLGRKPKDEEVLE